MRFDSLVDMQERSCAAHASAPLFGTKVDGKYQWLTYGEFAKRVDHFRAALAQLGVGKGDKVAVISSNRVEWAVAAYATYGLGAHFVPMYEAQQPKDWRYILNDSGSRVLLASTEEIYAATRQFIGEVDSLEHVLCFDAPKDAAYSFAQQLELGAEKPIDSHKPQTDEVAGLIYTSGTTGNPKGVVLSHGNFTSNVNAVHEIFPMSESDVSCSFLPWAHSFGQTVELHCMLSMGGAMGLAESVQTLMDDFGLVRPTVLFAVPRIFNKIYDGLNKKMADETPLKRRLFGMGLNIASKRRKRADEGDRSVFLDFQYAMFDRVVFSKIKERFGGRLRYVFSGGAALSKEVGEFIDDVGIMVFEGYGLTETSPISTGNTPDARRIGTVGKPIPGVEIYICDENQNVVPNGVDGEVVVVGPNVMQGYHNLPEVTKEVIFELNGKRAFRTGDMGQVGDDGFVKITGRFKEQYKLENGRYVVPTPLEEQLKLSGFVNQAFVFGDNRPFNICLIVPDFEALRRWGNEQGISIQEPAALVEHPLINEKIGEEISRFAASFKGYEKPRKWKLLTEEFTVENDMLTPKMSVKRRNVIKAYTASNDALYVEQPAEVRIQAGAAPAE